ncbi:hypothetical protein BDR05DRAFT_950311 [Suillus weaverae]|nr:hypothetical protein BDR05DRAFT_950311 [Suillus weaverae]
MHCKIKASKVKKDKGNPPTKCGQPNRLNNYSAADVKTLLDFIAEELPLGQKGWQAIHSRFTVLIETKFKQLVKTMKPTGDGVCPPDVNTCTHEIDAVINEHAGTHDLNDSEFNDQELGYEDSRNASSPIEHTMPPYHAAKEQQPQNYSHTSVEPSILLYKNMHTQLFDLKNCLHVIEHERDYALYNVKSSPRDDADAWFCSMPLSSMSILSHVEAQVTG